MAETTLTEHEDALDESLLMEALAFFEDGEDEGLEDDLGAEPEGDETDVPEVMELKLDADLEPEEDEEGSQPFDTAGWDVQEPHPSDQPDDPWADMEEPETISLYLREVGPIPLLTAAEEVALAKTIEAGEEARLALLHQEDPGWEERMELRRRLQAGQDAKDHFILANSRLVVSIAKRYRGRGVPFLDLIQEGNMGLLRAVEKFDWRKGYKFSTYATWWIRQAVSRCVADQGRTIRLPVHLGEQINRIHRTTRRLAQELGREPSQDEVAQDLDVPLDKVEQLLQLSRHTLSLESPVGEEGESNLGDFIEDEDSPDPSEEASRQVLRDRIQNLLHCLTPREARVLQLRYGLEGGPPHTLEEIGDKFGLTRERIRQIEADALRRLRLPARSADLRGFHN